ncbi:MAG: glycosyltransferase, partial [Gemmatimonadota bacterium]
MRLSVIVTTYNNPHWLAKVLWGFAAQTVTDFELLVADDGSDAPTAELIERMRAELPYPVRHVWHPKVGFRKCTILNAAIAKAVSASCCDATKVSDQGRMVRRKTTIERGALMRGLRGGDPDPRA